MGGMGGLGGMGGGMPTGGAVGGDPFGGSQSHPGESDKDREARIGYALPAASLTVDQKEGELDFTDDHSRISVFYTDGRKPQKSKDKRQEIAARWDAGHLISDEKTPRGGKLTRKFELSPDGRQMFETVEVDSSRIYTPTVLRYVYDAVPARP
jgi:hypothetical protein